LLLGGRLALKLGFERLLTVDDVRLVPVGIDECVEIARLPAVIFCGQAVVAAVGAEKNVAWQAFEKSKSTLVVSGNLRVGFVANQLVAFIHIRAADDDDA
jgi:hypothetical protein